MSSKTGKIEKPNNENTAANNRQSASKPRRKTTTERRKQRNRIYLVLTALAVLALAIFALVLIDSSADTRYQEYMQKARDSYTSGDYDGALLNLRRAQEYDPDNEETLMLMADCYEAQRNYEKALDTLRQMNTSDAAVSSRIQAIEQKRSQQSKAETIVIAGVEFQKNSTDAFLDGKGIGNEELKEISALYALDNLSLMNNQISDISLLSALGGLDTLNLSGNQITDITPLAGLTQLRTLFLDNNPISDFTALYSLPNLTSLSVSDTDIDEEGLKALAQALPSCAIRSDITSRDDTALMLGGVQFSVSATSLDLSGRGLRDISALSECTNLVTLKLKGNQISDLTPLMNLPNLQNLDVSGNLITDLRPLIGMKKLQILNVSDNLVDETVTVGSIRTLQELDLSGNDLLDNCVGLGKLRQLKVLDLSSTGLTDTGLASLDKLTGLTKLDVTGNPGLSNNAIGALRYALTGCTVFFDELVYDVDFCGHLLRSDETSVYLANSEIEGISGLDRMTALEELDLSGNLISNLYIFEYAGCRDTLKKLNLSHNDIYDIYPLAKLTALEELDLSGNRIAMIIPLKQITTLRVLDLSGNQITESQLEDLQDALPKCEIRFN